MREGGKRRGQVGDKELVVGGGYWILAPWMLGGITMRQSLRPREWLE